MMTTFRTPTATQWRTRGVQRQAWSLRSAARQIKRTKVRVLDFEFRHRRLRKRPLTEYTPNTRVAFFSLALAFPDLPGSGVLLDQCRRN